MARPAASRLRKKVPMDSEMDELGPVDYLVIEFPPGHQNFNNEMATELAKLVDSGIVKVLDLIVIAKDEDGKIDALRDRRPRRARRPSCHRGGDRRQVRRDNRRGR
jgi:hypothetical protein